LKALKFEKDSVINQNNYTRKLDKVEIATEKNILMGRDIDRKKISMSAIPLTEEDIANQKNCTTMDSTSL
jgi:NADH-quinone oxidoreductase subunit G